MTPHYPNDVKRLFLILTLLTAVTALRAENNIKPTWGVDFDAVFDNREGSNRYTDTKTFLFTSLAPEIGLRFGSAGRIAGGVVWNQPVGSGWKEYHLEPTLYFRRDGSETRSPWSFSMGMFPRRQLTEEMPGFLWSDSLAYHQRNIRGLLVQYRRHSGFAEAYVDWRGMQSRTQREAFNIVVHTRWHPRHGNPLFIGGYAMMNHFALQKDAPADQHIVDNFVVNPYAGVNLQGRTPLDSLILRAGPLLTLERNRASGNDWKTPLGAWVELCAEWRWLGLKNTFYAGGRQQPSYIPFRSDLYQGEPFYQAKLYNRTDVYANVLRSRYVTLRAGLDFHVTPDAFTFYQRVILAVTLP